jgi:hypothetical protein
MVKTCPIETINMSEEKLRQLEKARRLLEMLNAHVMSDEGVLKTSFTKVVVN